MTTRHHSSLATLLVVTAFPDWAGLAEALAVTVSAAARLRRGWDGPLRG